MSLTATDVKNAKPSKKTTRLYDAAGMYLEVSPKGGKYWRMKYRFHGKEKRLALGVYPEVSLKEARDERDDARKLLRKNIDPSVERKAKKVMRAAVSSNSFEAVAREWFIKYSANWSENHSSRIIRRLERDIFPWLGSHPIKEITAPELLQTLRRIEDRGALDTAHRAMQNCGQVFRYGVATGRTERDPSGDLKGALPPVRATHHASITDPKEIGGLLRALDDYTGHFVTKCALRISPLLFVRPGELRHAQWQEVDLDKAEWRIPAEKMKAGAMHIVPLSNQTLEILSDLKPLTGPDGYLFPSIRTDSKPMSDNTINAALRRMGYTKTEMTGHGFRSMASTLLNEQGWHHDAIERQLAHTEKNSVRAAYNYAEHLPERRKMMQAWSDYLDGLKKGADIVPLKSKSN